MSRGEPAERGYTLPRRSAEHGYTFPRRSAEHGFRFSQRFAEHGFTSERRASEGGFTLIEIMVALAVFSLAALALIRLEGATIRSTALLQSTLLAQIVARNVAVEAVSDVQPPTRGRVSGAEQNGGRAWRWVRDVRAIGDGDVMRVDVAVADRDGAVLARATMIRPPAQLASVQR